MRIDSSPDEPARARETLAAPDRDDTPDTAGSRGTRGRPDAAELRREQIAEHVRYQGVVDAAHAAYDARQAWAEAVPRLRVEWTDHRQKYPERSRASPGTQADGSWTGDAARTLNPEQNAEAGKACADLRDEAVQVILPAMHRVEVASPAGRLAGLDHMLKGEDRLKEKLAEYMLAPGVTVRGAMDKVPDAVRFTLTYELDHYAEGVRTDVEHLIAEGFELLKLKNLWHAEQYKGINSQWRRPDTGLRFEMQFHTPESREAKELTHEAYERLRSKTVSAAEERELEAYQRRTNALLAIPPGTDQIKDFPE